MIVGFILISIFVWKLKPHNFIVMKIDFAIKGNNLLLPNGISPGLILVKGGKIEDVLFSLDYSIDTKLEDAGQNLVMAGVIDPHVHINEPGRTEWEGFDTATRAAATGGITMLVDMPLNSSPVTTSVKNLEQKIKATAQQLHVNCAFWGGVVPGNTNELEGLLESGVLGLKAFLTHSGIDEFPNSNREDLYKALLILKKYDKPLLVHCELDEFVDNTSLNQNPRSYQAYLKSRPASWEDKAIAMMIGLCRETESRVHIVHLSSASSIEQIRAARNEGLPLTVETGQHYLFFDAESIPDGDTRFKCAPPIRERKNNDQLWRALMDGTIDFIATDHSPAPPELKEVESGDFKKAWGGIAGLQFALPVVWTAAKSKGLSIAQVAKWLNENPSRFIKCDSSKGKIKKGYDADIITWDPEKKFIVDAKKIQHRHKLTPYEGNELSGVVMQTYVNGIKVYNNGKLLNLNSGIVVLKK